METLGKKEKIALTTASTPKSPEPTHFTGLHQRRGTLVPGSALLPTVERVSSLIVLGVVSLCLSALFLFFLFPLDIGIRPRLGEL